MTDSRVRPAPQAGPPRARPVGTWLRLGVCVGSLTYVLAAHDVGGALARLRDIDLRWLLLALLLVYAALLLRSMKWHGILTAYGQPERLARLWTLYVQSYFFNLLLPGQVAGDVSRIVRTSTEGRFSVPAFMAVLLERLSGLLTTAVFIAAVAMLGGYQGLGTLVPSILWLVMIVILGTAALPVALGFAGVPILALPAAAGRRLARVARQLEDATAVFVAHPRLLARLVALSALFVVFSGATVWAIGRAVGSPIPGPVLLVYTPLIALVANLPLSIAGLGVRENLYVLCYGALGFLPEAALALALSESALLLLVSASGGLLLWHPPRLAARALTPRSPSS